MALKNRSFATLSDPRFIGALVTLIVNDWWLKPEVGGWLTGKLSDIAGLVVLPVVVAGVLGALRVPRPSTVAIASIGTWFAAIKTLEPAARATERLAEAVTGAVSVIVVDPTDLIGLAGLFVAAAIVAKPRPLLGNRVAKGVLFAVAMLACTATSNSGGTPTDLGLTAEGEVVMRGGYYESSEDFDDVAEAAGDVDPADLVEGFGERVREACTIGPEADECFRLVDGRVERQTPTGAWKLDWQLFDAAIVSKHVGAGLDYEPSMHATDIIASPDGSVHVAFDGIDPIERTAAGDWLPPVGTHRPIVHMVAMIVVAFGAAVVAAATKTVGARFTIAALAVAATSALFAWAGSSDLIGSPIASAIASTLALGAVVYAAAAARQQPASRGHIRLSLTIGLVGIVAAIGCLIVWKYVVGAPAMLWSLAPAVAFVGVVGANVVTALADR